MALTAGSRLGPYEVLSPLGAGGMGEVYRARDTRLDRTVAIKVLPEQFSNNLDLKQRFEREARAISALNHPNICTLHDVGHEGGTDYLVMEYLEGESLAERIAKGPLPLQQVVNIGSQVADALDKAHRQGIVHRDLKPGNVMLTKSGAKLLDFGLAKPAAVMGASSSATAVGITQTSPASPITQAGHIVGTFQYMAPEQVEGREADSRSDIFALGAVLYEMATGKRAFEGKSTFSVATAILEKDPEPISKLQPMTPPVLEYVVATCLRKDPEERFQTAHDVKLQLRWVLEGGSQAGVAAPVAARRKHRAWLAWGVAGALFAATVVLAYVAYREHSKVPTAVIQSWIEQPEKQVFAFSGDGGGPPAISPDGTRVVYAAIDSTGKQHLWMRALDTIAAQMIAGTDNGTFPFWSPDSKKIGFFADGSLKVADLYGGSPLVLCPAAAGRGGAWNKDDVIIFSPNFTAGLYTVSATGGTPTQILDPTGTQFSSYRWPQFMPDSKHFIFLAVQHEKPSDSTLMFAKLGGGQPKEVMKTGSAARYASGRLLYLRESALYSQAFDPSSGKVSGELSAVADQVLWDVSVWRGVFDVSDNGELVYERGLAMTPTRLAWFDLTGKQLSTVDVSTGFANLNLTRDGRRLVAQGNPATSELWAYELSRGTRTRVTFDAWTHTFPIWSADNKWIAYVAANPAGGSRICRKLADGSGEEEVLYESAKTKATTDWSPDGKYILYVEPNDNLQGSGIWALPVEGEHKPFPLLRTPFLNLNARFSPDGKWVAFQSSESDRQEIYVISFPKPTGKWQVSLEGGMVPQWTNDGSHIYFISTTTNQIMAAEVSTKGGNFSVGTVKTDFPLTGSATLPWFALSADGKSILAPAPTNEHQPPITLVTNWTAKVKK